MLRQMGDEFYKFKVLPGAKGNFRVGMLVKMMFFDKEQAEMAREFLLKNPNHTNKEDIEVVVDYGY